MQQCLHRFGLVRSYGLVSQPGLACTAFDEMQRLGVWQPNDVKTANALLNAVHADATTTYERYMHVCSSSASLVVPDRIATPALHQQVFCNVCVVIFVYVCWQPCLLSCHDLMCNGHGLMRSYACWHEPVYSSHARHSSSHDCVCRVQNT